MADLLEIIKRDRGALMRLIDILDAQLARLRDPGSDPDYHLLLDIMRYCLHYLPATLFKYEDALFAYLAERDPEYLRPAAALKRRHERHATLAEALFTMLEGICSGHLAPRERLLKEACAYVALQREHLAAADAGLIDAAGARLSAADLERVRARTGLSEDIAPIVAEYTRLAEAIEEAVLVS